MSGAWWRWAARNKAGALALALLLVAPLALGRLPTQGIDRALGRYEPYARASSRPAFVALALGALGAAIVRAGARRARPRPAGEGGLEAAFDAGFALYFAGVAAAALARGGPALRMYPALAYVLVAAASLVAARAKAPARVARLALLAVALAAAAGVVADAEGFAPWWPGARPEYVRRPGGFFANRNGAGEFLALALPSCVVAAAPCPWALVPYGLALALTRSRTAWLVGTLGVGLALACSTPARRRARGLAAAGALAGALAAPLLPATLRWHSPRPYGESLAHLVDLGEGSGALRLAQYGATLRVGGARLWLGLGPDQWHRTLRPAEPALAKNYIPMSEYVRALADGGALSLGGLGLMLAAAAARAWRRRRALPDGPAFVAALALACAASAPLFRLEAIALWALWATGLLGRGGAAAPAGPEKNPPAGRADPDRRLNQGGAGGRASRASRT